MNNSIATRRYDFDQSQSPKKRNSWIGPIDNDLDFSSSRQRRQSGFGDDSGGRISLPYVVRQASLNQTRYVAAEADDERFGVMADVEGFLKRREGLPSYISRQHIFRELTNILTASKVPPAKKTRVMELVERLQTVELIEKKKGKLALSIKDVRQCLGVIYPPVVEQLGSRSESVRESALGFLMKGLNNDKLPVQTVVGVLAMHGIRSTKDSVAIASMEQIPGIFAHKGLMEFDLVPVLEALYGEMNSKGRQKSAAAALSRMKSALGDSAFEKLSGSSATDSQRTVFEAFDGHRVKLNRRKPPDGVSFGMIPNTIINRLTEKANRTNRAEGAMMLQRYLEQQGVSELAPFAGRFVKFLGRLLEENYTNSRVLLHVLGIHSIMLESCPSAMVKQKLVVVYNLLNIGFDSILHVKAEVFRLLNLLMQVCGTQPILEIALAELEHKNAKFREDLLQVVIFSLLTFPSNDFDLETLARTIAPTTLDSKKRVRQAAMECLALISQCMGPAKAAAFKQVVKNMDCGTMSNDFGEVVSAVLYRVSRKQLPRVSEEGCVEYGLQISSSDGKDDRMPDIEWIKRAGGTLSKTPSSSGDSVSYRKYGRSVTESKVSLRSLSSESSKSTSARRRRRRRNSRIPKRHGKSKVSRSLENLSKGDCEDLDVAAESFSSDEMRPMEMLDSALEKRRISAYNIVEPARKTGPPRGKAQKAPPAAAGNGIGIDSNSSPAEKGKVEVIHTKRVSMEMRGVVTSEIKTQFDQILTEKGRGSFENPEKAWKMARQDLKSTDWQSSIEGLEAMVRLIVYHVDIINEHTGEVLPDLISECKNLRSQVSRAALQTAAILFSKVGMKLSYVNGLDALMLVLLTKTTDTNRFIRSDACTALESIANHVSIHKAVTALHSLGTTHKNSQARTITAKLVGSIVGRIGTNVWMEMAVNAKDLDAMEPNFETVNAASHCGAALLLEGNIDTRTAAKTIFAGIVSHEKFESVILQSYLGKLYSQRQQKLLALQKNLNNLKSQNGYAEI